MSWSVASPSEEAQFGTVYRTTLYLRQYWDYWMILALDGLARLKAAAAPVVKLERYRVYTPGEVPLRPGVDESLVRKPDTWAIEFEWKKAGPGTPVHVLVALAIAAVLAVTISWLIVARVTERQFEEVRTDARDFFRELFNPGLVVSALIGLALVTRKRG